MRIRACLATLVLTLSAAGASATTAAGALASQPQPRPANLVTVSQNALRDGWDPNEPGLSPGTVGGGTFGQLFKTTVDGQVYAQPLVVDNPGAPSTDVIVGTENDTVYSINGTTGKVNWQTSVGAPWLASASNCTDLTPLIGITSTPVYDPSTGELYVVADVTGPPGQAPGSSSTSNGLALVALNEQTGHIDWQQAIGGHPVNAPSLTFDATHERQRVGLLLMNDANGNPWVYMAFGSICDHKPYIGYVAGVNVGTTSQGAQTLWSDETGSAADEAGIWQSGGGLVSDGPGRIIVSSGNGVSPPSGPGSPTPSELGDAVVRLDVQPDGSLKADDFFSPANAPTLDATDRDLGSGGPIGLPAGTSQYPDLIVQAGKDGRVFLLNGHSLGGRGATTDTPLSESGPYGGQWGHPAAFAGSDGTEYVYYSGTGEGSTDFMRALRLNPGSGTAPPTLTEVANTTVAFGYSSGSPVVTSNGSDPSSAVVWEVATANGTGANGTLEAFSAAAPGNGILRQIWSAPIGTAAKFAVAATDGGRVYVGTRGSATDPGDVYGFGVTTGTPPFTGTQPVTFADAGVSGSSSTATVTLTATGDVTVASASVTAATSPSPFTLGTASVNGSAVSSFPVNLTAGQQLTLPLTFSPTATGEFTGSLQLVAADPSGSSTVNVALAGTGTTPGLTAEPTTLAFGKNATRPNDTNFGPVPIGLSEPIQATITNTATTPETITSVTGPTGPFTMTGLPAGSQSTPLQPGQSMVITATYTPTTVTTTDASTITVSYTNGTTTGTTQIGLTGVSEAASEKVTPSTTSVNFGQVRLGTTATTSVTFTNTGNLPLTVSKFTGPGVPFWTALPIPKGLSISPGDDISVPVSYTPQAGGTATGSFQLTMADSQGHASTLTIGLAGSGVRAAQLSLPSPGGGWTLNGSAAMQGTTLDLTPAALNQAGSAVYYQPQASNGLKATFREQSSGGTGGDGMTLSLVSASTPVTAIGARGPVLGYGGLQGIAIVVGTRKLPGFPSANFVGIATGTSNDRLVFAATSSAVPNLRSGTHVIGVAVAGQKVTVSVDGRQYLAATVAIPATVRPMFTATTSSASDVHAVSGVSITSTFGAIPAPGGGWSYNGSAIMAGSDTQLTPATAYQAGTVIYPRAVSTSSVTAQFDVQIGGGSGANGMTFAFLNPATPATSVGATGSGLGLQSMAGVGAVLSTYPILGTQSSNLVAIVKSTGTGLSAVTSKVPVAQLNSGTHVVTVTLVANSNGTHTMGVYVDGALVARTNVAVGPTALLAFTGATGKLTDIHTVREAAIAATGWS